MLKDDLISGAKDAADYLGQSRSAVYHMVAQGNLPAIKKGKRLFFRRSELDRAFCSDTK